MLEATLQMSFHVNLSHERYSLISTSSYDQNNVPVVIVSVTASRINTAPMGYPFANGFAMVTISGWHSTGQEECAHNVPVLYSPHCAQTVSNAVSAPSWNGRLGSEQNTKVESKLERRQWRVLRTSGS